LQTEFLGESGVVKIDSFGDRTDIDVAIRQLDPSLINDIVGTWSPSSGILWANNRGRRKGEATSNGLSNVNGGPLIITTVLVTSCLSMHVALGTYYLRQCFSIATFAHPDKCYVL
jgi:hypothetical protein